MKAGMDQSSSNVGSKYKSSVQRVKNKTLATLGDVAGDTLATADVSTDNNLSYNGSTSANGIQGRASQVLGYATQGASSVWSSAKTYKFQALTAIAVAGLAGAGYMMLQRKGKIALPEIPRFRSSDVEQKPSKKRGKKH